MVRIRSTSAAGCCYTRDRARTIALIVETLIQVQIHWCTIAATFDVRALCSCSRYFLDPKSCACVQISDVISTILQTSLLPSTIES